MATQQTIIYVAPQFFGELEKPILINGTLRANTFRFASGVCGVRLVNERGAVVMLPFQGQQIWSAEFDGRNLKMKSMFTEPRPGVPFLETFGGFLQHCGAIAMGGPSPKDTHPLHGELPNAPYQTAYLVTGEDKQGAYIGLGGQYQHTVAFGYNYLAEPLVKLYAGSTLLKVEMTITNLKASTMELMYLMHINFKPVDHGRLVYSAHCTPEHVRTRTGTPAHIKPLPGYTEFLDELKNLPEKHNVLKPGLAFDPEVALFIDYLADADGWAHSLQIHPDGLADYVAHRPDQLPKATRWICRTPDQDAIAIVEPGTAEPEGYLAEKAKGNIMVLPPHGQFHGQVLVGALAADDVAPMEQKVKQIIK
jgi:Domain of unknown function (DUF4432)